MYNAKRKTASGVILACKMTLGPHLLNYQILSKYFWACGSFGAHKQYLKTRVPVGPVSLTWMLRIWWNHIEESELIMAFLDYFFFNPFKNNIGLYRAHHSLKVGENWNTQRKKNLTFSKQNLSFSLMTPARLELTVVRDLMIKSQPS